MKDKTSNFWTTCPKKLDFYPDNACPLGKNGLSSNETLPKCSWFINSELDHYCFWTWLRRTSSSNGEMDPLTQSEISELLKIPMTKVNNDLKQALENLKNTNEFKDLFPAKNIK